ncbi:hypothetical protein, partial [Actinoplanes auranticolor]
HTVTAAQNGSPAGVLDPEAVRALVEAFIATSEKLAEARPHAVDSSLNKMTAAIEGLDDRVATLQQRIVAQQHQLDHANRAAGKTSLYYFVGGIAVSIPIGVIINLATK